MEDSRQMYGGWRSGKPKTLALNHRLTKKGLGNVDSKTGKFVPQKKAVQLKSGKTVQRSVHTSASSRSYKAFVDKGDGKYVELIGEGHTYDGKAKEGGKVTGNKDTSRYFHGDPIAAARKVVGRLHRENPGSVTGIENAVKLHLIEVTKGVHKVNGDKFEYNYFAWREMINAVPVTKEDSKGNKITVTYNAKNIAIPVRGVKTAKQALALSNKAGITKKKISGAKPKTTTITKNIQVEKPQPQPISQSLVTVGPKTSEMKLGNLILTGTTLIAFDPLSSKNDEALIGDSHLGLWLLSVPNSKNIALEAYHSDFGTTGISKCKWEIIASVSTDTGKLGLFDFASINKNDFTKSLEKLRTKYGAYIDTGAKGKYNVEVCYDVKKTVVAVRLTK